MMLKPRKRFFVHPGIQGSLVIRLVGQWGLFVVAACLVSLALQYMLDPLAPAEQRMFQLRTSIGAFLLVSLCLMPVLVRDAIRFSNRFVGPVIRLQSELRKVDEIGELRSFRLREDDFWQDLASDYNDFAERLRNSQQNAELERSAAMVSETVAGRDGGLGESAS